MRKYLFIMVAAVLLTGCVKYKDGEPVKDEAYEKRQQEEQESKEENATAEKEEKEEEEVSTDEYKNMAFGEYSIKDISTEINGDELILRFDWINQSGKDDMPFTGVGYLDVTQGDDILDETSGAYDPMTNSDVLRKAANGVTLPVKLIYEIENDEPIKILFGATHEIDDGKEELVIEDWK